MTAPTDPFAVGDTPLTDKWHKSYIECDSCFKAGLDEGRLHANQMERRMRAAEKLLDTVDANHALQWAGLHGRQRDVSAHLEAARREDAK